MNQTLRTILLHSAAILLLIGGCMPEPHQIRLGEEECAWCRMVITDSKFASQILNTRGRTWNFDSIECMTAFSVSQTEEERIDVHSRWVPDFAGSRELAGTHEWVAAGKAHYLRSETLASPMGMNLSAYASLDAAKENHGIYGGMLLDWNEVSELIHSEWLKEDPAQARYEGPHKEGSPHAGQAFRANSEESTAETMPESGAMEDGVIHVRPGSSVSSLEEALSIASAGDEIRVWPGVYPVHELEITLPVTIRGSGYPVLDGGKQGHILLIQGTDITISGLEFRNSGSSQIHDYSALLIEDSANITIENNRFNENFFDVYLADSRNSRIVGNEITATEARESTSANGLHLWNTEGIVLEDNSIRGKRDGIYIEFSRNIRIRRNISEGNIRYGLHFMFTDDSAYEGNRFNRNGAGVAVMYSNNVDMVQNRFENNWGSGSYGLLLKDMSRSRISHNLFFKNTVAIYSEGSHRLEVFRNDIEQNGWAVKITSNSSDHRFFENNFIGNSFDVSTNTRRSYNLFEGNYWSQYEGYDLDRDGTGDVPYRPVRLFSIILERQPEALILLRSMMISLLDMAERVMPVLTPDLLIDEQPKMSRFH